MQNRRRRDTSHSELSSLQRTLASTERIAAHQQKLRSGDTSSLLPASRKSANDEHSRWSHKASCMALGPATPTASLRHAQTADEPLDACLKAAAAGKEALQSRTWTCRRSDDGQRSIMTTGLTKCCLERLTPGQRLQTSAPAYKVPPHKSRYHTWGPSPQSSQLHASFLQALSFKSSANLQRLAEYWAWRRFCPHSTRQGERIRLQHRSGTLAKLRFGLLWS